MPNQIRRAMALGVALTATLTVTLMVALTMALATAAAGEDGERVRRWHWQEPSPTPVSIADPGPYPVYAGLYGIEGWAKIGFQIGPKGEVWGFLILASSPAGVFEANCLDLVKTLRYRPQFRSDKSYPMSRSWSYTCKYQLAR